MFRGDRIMDDVALSVDDWTVGPLATKALDLLCDGRGRLERWNFASYFRKRNAGGLRWNDSEIFPIYLCGLFPDQRVVFIDKLFCWRLVEIRSVRQFGRFRRSLPYPRIGGGL